MNLLSKNEDTILISLGDRLTEFMKVSKNCGVSTNQGCFSNKQSISDCRTVGNSSSSDDNFDLDSNAYKFVLADGTSVAIVPYFGLKIVVNLDGPTKKPVLGKNTFYFVYDYDGTNFKD